MCQKNYTIETEKKKVFKYKHLNYIERTQIIKKLIFYVKYGKIYM